MRLPFLEGLMCEKDSQYHVESFAKIAVVGVLVTVVVCIAKHFAKRGQMNFEGLSSTQLEKKEVELQSRIVLIESQIEAMRVSIESLKGSILIEEKANMEGVTPLRSVNQSKFKASRKTTANKNNTHEDGLTYQQKKDLSEAIGKMDGSALERVIRIIHEGVPEIRDSTEEIELEIDLLPAAVLTKLYNYACRTKRQLLPTSNRNDTPQLEDHLMTNYEGESLSFEQKKCLAESIGKLDEPSLERVIQILEEDVPEARNNPGEIEIEIDALPAVTLIKLYRYVVESKREPTQPKHILLGST